MTTKPAAEPKSDNEIIARFMGAEFVRKPHVFYPDQYTETYIFKGHPGNWRVEKETKSHITAPMLCYHTDWDWIMPVVEKIEEIALNVVIETGCVTIDVMDDAFPEYHSTITFEWQEDTKLNVTYRAVVEFIKWYNQHGK